MSSNTQLSVEEYKQREKTLYGVLNRLSSDEVRIEESIDDIVDCLSSIYQDGLFRHMYSRFYTLVAELDQDGRETLATNLSYIFNETQIRFRNGDDKVSELVCNSIAKVYDHINIEISRAIEATRHSKTELSLEAELKRKEELIKNLSAEVKKANDDLSAVNNKYEKSTTDIIAVLGIFSAVVMVFFGGFSYISNAITTLSSVSLNRASIICLVAGFVTMNTIVTVMYMISKIIGRDVTAYCKKNETGTCKGCEKKCSSLLKLCRKLPFVFWLNICVLGLLILAVSYNLFLSNRIIILYN